MIRVRARPHLALELFVLLAVATALAAALGRAEFLVEPLRAQVEGRAGGGYTVLSLATWAGLGALGVVAFAQEARRRPLLAPGPWTLPALVPALAFGPLFHVLLADGALSGPLAWLASEPLVYATVAALVLALGAAGAAAWSSNRERGRDLAILAGGTLALLAAVAVAVPRAGPDARWGLGLAGLAVLLGGAAWVALALPRSPRFAPYRRPIAPLIFFGHALDGVTTWIGVRDPLGWGLPRYGEKNPVSAALLEIGNGWTFLALKLALPAVLLYALRDLEDPLHERLALLAVFVLGFGPGASNALQFVLRG